MTPYAVLLVRPLDSDLTIKHAFHRLAETCHPDKFPAGQTPEQATLWYAIAKAYTLIKSVDLRQYWELHHSAFSGLCESCSGTGVRGGRVGRMKVRVCDNCAGEGRVKQ